MDLEVIRFSSAKDSTLGLLFNVTNDKREFLCYTLEDEYREEKVMHETRIPAGTYEIKLRTWGRIHENYTKRFADIHKGTLWLQDVPNFKYILIHAGNTDEQTEGCILVGDSQNNNDIQTDGFIGSSRNAYKRIYPLVRDALLAGASATIEIIDYEEGMTASSTEDKDTNQFQNIGGGVFCYKCSKTIKTKII